MNTRKDNLYVMAFLCALVMLVARTGVAGENLVQNGTFEGRATQHAWGGYWDSEGFSCPGWKFEGLSGLAKSDGVWVTENLSVGEYAMILQPWKDAAASQVIPYLPAGDYRLSFNYTARPRFPGKAQVWLGKTKLGEVESDTADVHFYSGADMRLPKGCTPVDQCAAYAAFGTKYPLNEFRACWKNGGRPLVQRLNDKPCSWKALGWLIPEMQAASLLGHLFVCPDLIYGGLLGSFKPGAPIDQELFVRSTQVHALSPMMQFSASPRRVLDDAHFALVKAAVELRGRFMPYIFATARASAKSGEPMLKPMEYAFPGNGYASVKDQFVLGDALVVAPQTVKGAQSRTVLIPPGRWRADDGAEFDGPCRIEAKTPLSRLPYFTAVAK